MHAGCSAERSLRVSFNIHRKVAFIAKHARLLQNMNVPTRVCATKRLQPWAETAQDWSQCRSSAASVL
jgi:hypothetical protein